MLMIGSLLILAVSFILVFGWHLRDRAVAASIIKAKTDLEKCNEITNRIYQGDWAIKDGILYKGDRQISGQTELVDCLANITGGTVTIFLGDTRVATTVRMENGERAIGTKVSDIVGQTVLKNGQMYLGEANVVGNIYQTAYEPIRDIHGKIIGMFYVGVSKSFGSEMIANSLITMTIFGIGLIVIVSLFTWFFIQKVIIHPLYDITLGTHDVASGHVTEKVNVPGSKEIGELALAFNQMVERLESVAEEINRVTGTTGIEPLEQNRGKVSAGCTNSLNDECLTTYKFERMLPEGNEESGKAPVCSSDVCREGKNVLDESDPIQLSVLKFIQSDGLPKGLNEVTLKRIIEFLQTANELVSVEYVADRVKLTRVTVRRYLEFLEDCGLLVSELKYGTVGRPLKLFLLKIKE